MQVIYGTAELYLPYSHSLKEKRKVTKSIVGRMRSRFNLSVAEVDYHDLWQRCLLAFALVAQDNNEASFIIDTIKDTILSYDEVELTHFEFQYAQ